MTVGGVLREAAGLYRRFFGRFVATAAAVFVLVSLLGAIAADAADTSAGAVWLGLYLAVGILGAVWVQGALVVAVDGARRGETGRTIGDLYDAVRPRLPSLVAAGLLLGLAVGGLLGLAAGAAAFAPLALLVVPALYLLTRWILVTPVIVLEGRRAVEAFGRSRELVSGRGWRVFAVILLTLSLSLVVQLTFLVLLAPLPAFAANWLGGLLAASLATPLVVLAWTVMYYRLEEA